MTERGNAALERSADHLSIGPSGLSWDGGRLVIDIDEWTAPIPRRLKGRITVLPDALFGAVHLLDAGGVHRWRPTAPCSAVQVDFENPALRWQGRAYCDINAGDAPLERDLRCWTWSRLDAGRSTSIIYDVEPRNGDRRGLALTYRPDGSMQAFAAPPHAALPSTGWRLRRQTRSEDGHAARLVTTLEDTPFYSRSVVDCRLAGTVGQAIHESVDLDRFASPVVQWMLPFKMPRRGRSAAIASRRAAPPRSFPSSDDRDRSDAD